MLLSNSLLAFSALLHQAIAAPGAAELEKRVIATTSCNRDNLYRSFIDPRTSASASSFCSTYIQSTVKTAATTTATVTAAAAKLDLEAPEAKRDLGATTYPASRLSSACSCILTAQPTPTTVYTTTVTVTTTVKPSAACTVPTPIVKNGGFESGLAPWVVATVIPPYPEYSQYESFGVQAPGYNSPNAFTVSDQAASSYFELDLTQTITLCAGQQYKFTAEFYMTDSHNIPTKETYLTFYVDNTVVGASKFSDGKGPPIVWTPLSGTFTAGGSSATLKAAFVATNIVGVTWGIDNVVITPA